MKCEITKNNDNWVMEVSADETPTDYVNVVRCKDCMYCKDNWCYAVTLGGHFLSIEPVDFYAISVNPNHFCSYGERKETNE